MPAPPVPNANAPLAICGVDPDNGVPYAIGLANATTLNTAGTTTVDATGAGVFYGFAMLGVGTGFSAAAFDVNGTNTTTLLAVQTSTAVGAVLSPGPGGLGLRYGGNLVVVTAGTPGAYNALWD